MGIDTQAWRCRIGCFSGHSARDKFIVPAIFVRGQLVRATLRLAVLVFTLLVVAGDVESHPGPRGDETGAKGSTFTQSQLSFRGSADRRMTRNSSSLEVNRGHQEPDRIDRILSRLDEIGDQIYDVDKKLDREIKLVNERLDVHDERCSDLEAQNNALFDKLSRLEDQSRRDNLIFWGLPEKTGSDSETWGECEQTIRTVLCEKLQIANADDDSIVSIERAHRLNGTGQGNKPRAIIVKFGRFKHKQLVAEKAREVKNPDIRVSDDYSASVRATRKKLIPHLVKLRSDFPTKKVFLRYDTLVVDRKVYVPDGDDDIRELVPAGRRR